MTTERVAEIEARLAAAFSPTEMLVKDQTHLHAGHAGAKDGLGHFDVTIVSEVFEGARSLARHRMIFDSLGSLMDTDIHALRIHAYTPIERQGGE